MSKLVEALPDFPDFAEEVKNLIAVTQYPVGTAILEVIKTYSVSTFMDMLETSYNITNSTNCDDIKATIKFLYGPQNAQILCDEIL